MQNELYPYIGKGVFPILPTILDRFANSLGLIEGGRRDWAALYVLVQHLEILTKNLKIYNNLK